MASYGISSTQMANYGRIEATKAYAASHEMPLAALPQPARGEKLGQLFSLMGKVDLDIESAHKAADQLANAAKVALLRTEINETMRLNAWSIMYLAALVDAKNFDVVTTAVECIHNLLWPDTHDGLIFCGNFLCLDRLVHEQYDDMAVQVILEMLGAMAGPAVLGNPENPHLVRMTAAVLRYLLCCSVDVWSQMNPVLQAGLFKCLEMMLQSGNKVVFAEAMRAAKWIADYNPRQLDKVILPLTQPAWTCFLKGCTQALATWPVGEEQGALDSAPVWALLSHLAQHPTGRYRLLWNNCRLGRPDMQEDESFEAARLREDAECRAACAGIMDQCAIQALHASPAAAHCALLFLSAVTADAPQHAGTCAEAALIVCPDAGKLLVSLAMALRDAGGMGRTKDEMYGRAALQKLLAPETLGKWIAYEQAPDEYTEGAIQGILGGLCVLVYDFFGSEVAQVDAVEKWDFTFVSTQWLMHLVLDAITCLAYAAPGNLIARLDRNLTELLVGLGGALRRADAHMASKAAQIVQVVAVNKPKVLKDNAVLAEQLVGALASRFTVCNELSTQRCMAACVDALHACVEGSEGYHTLLHLFEQKGLAENASPVQNFLQWIGFQEKPVAREIPELADPARVPACVRLLQGLPIAMETDNMAIVDRAAAVLQRALTETLGFGWRTLVDLPPLQVEPTVSRLLKRTVFLLQDGMHRTQSGAFSQHQELLMRNLGIILHQFVEEKQGMAYLNEMPFQDKTGLVTALTQMRRIAGSPHIVPSGAAVANKVLHVLLTDGGKVWGDCMDVYHSFPTEPIL